MPQIFQVDPPVNLNDPATWNPLAPLTDPPVVIGTGEPPFPTVPKKTPLATATPQPSQGNAIASNPLSWHQMLISALIVGVSIWLVEQYADPKYALLLAILILIGVMYAYSKKGFVAELQAITKGKA